jgi:transcriptional regulator
MYLRAIHTEFDIKVLRRFIKENPLGILISAIESPNFATIQCTHMPWVLDVEDEQSTTELGRLRGHLAKANQHSKVMVEAVQRNTPSNGYLEQEVSIIFNGPVDAYVTPKFYTDTKPATGKVVPTWNYSAVQAYGKAKIFYDSQNDETGAYLEKQINDLTKYAEEVIMHHIGGDNLTAWEVNDAPKTYVDILKKSIIGIEIKIDRLEGKFKMSQERTSGDRDGVVKGFESLGTEKGQKMAESVRERGELKDSKASSASAN